MNDTNMVLGQLLMLLGLLTFIVGGLWFLANAFSESVLWGLAVLFIPFVSLLFLIVHRQVAKRPFFVQLAGFVLIMLGIAVEHR